MILFLPYFLIDVTKKLLVLTQKFKIYILSECYKKVAVVIKTVMMTLSEVYVLLTDLLLKLVRPSQRLTKSLFDMTG